MSRIHHQYGLLLGLILVSLAVQLAAPNGDVARLVVVTVQAVTLVVAVIASRAHRWVIRLAIVASMILVLGAAGVILGTEELGTHSTRVVTLLLVAVTPPAIVVGLTAQVRDHGGVTLQTMFGVLCVYLLIGMLFGNVFGAIDEFGEPDFFQNGAHATSDFLYFSFATLTTVGYGDFVAQTSLGRSLAITEALIGQIYLVTVVAVIVSNLRPRSGRSRG
ncbi:MAG: two pore domain potassium channel family protein [Solirubrobacterales bacterium]|nr:two pore domain potassium channel family protein [Solirubrobacterales bacterium]